MMLRITMFMIMIGLSAHSLCWASGWEGNLSAGSTSVQGGIHYKKDLNTGYMKTGISALFTDDGDMEYDWAQLKFAVGSDNIRPGLTMEVGLDGIIGEAENNGFSGDVGAVAFTGYIGYLFPKQIIPIPLRIYGGLSYAPEALSFRDTENYLSYHFGVGVQVVRNASVNLEFHEYDVDMKAGPGHWNLDDDVIRFALVMHF